jgi:hypothetical protein
VTSPRTPKADDAALAALCKVANSSTICSIKQTILACLLIRAVTRPTSRRRGAVASIVVLAALVGLHWPHIWSVLVHFI